MLDELEAFLGHSRGDAADPDEVVRDRVVTRAVGVAEEGRVAANGREPGPVAGHDDGPLGNVPGTGRVGRERQSRPLEQLEKDVRGLVGRAREVATEIGQSLADQALGRVDQEDRSLEAAAPLDEVHLLPGVLEVMTGERLVGDHVEQLGRADRQVRVQVDPRTESAVVPVVAGPGLALDEPDPQVLAFRQTEVGRRPAAETRDQPVDERREPLDGELERGVPGGQAVLKRPVAGE